MSVPGTAPRTCPTCNGPIVYTGRGRPKEYCGRPCQRRKGKAPAEAPQTGPQRLTVLEAIHRTTGHLLDAEYRHRQDPISAENLAGLLTDSEKLHKSREQYQALLVRQMRAEGMPWKDIAAAARISASTARRRWSSARLDRELRHLAPPVAQPAQPSGRGRHLPRQSPAEDGAPPGTSDKAAPPPEETPLTSAQQLAAALSHLQRASKLPMRELGQAAGVSASYVSRVLSGERVPSWDVTRRIALACGGDPPAIRTLWRTARGLTTSAKIAPVDAVDAVHAALRGLYLSAGRPDPHDISLGCHNTMTEREITATLDGERLPDWPTLGRLVLALDGRPATMRPLWEAAHRNPAPAAGPPGLLGRP